MFSSGEHNRQPSSACNGYFDNSGKGNESRVCASIEETSVMQTLHITHIVPCIDLIIYLFGNKFNHFRHHTSFKFKYLKNICRFVFFVRIAFANLVFILWAFCSHLTVSEVKWNEMSKKNIVSNGLWCGWVQLTDGDEYCLFILFISRASIFSFFASLLLCDLLWRAKGETISGFNMSFCAHTETIHMFIRDTSVAVALLRP